MNNDSLYIAVDLGAGSGRVFIGGFGFEGFLFEEAHRFTYPPHFERGHLRWDFSAIFDNIKTGLRIAAERANELGCEIESIGVDSWAVDYGLIDESGNLLANPVCYRDSRTAGVMEKVFPLVGKDEIFETTGIQFLPFNTIFQLAAEAQIPNGTRLLLIPDLINFRLTGNAATEFTNATTTQLINAATGDWDLKLLEKLNIRRSLLTDIVPAGSEIGKLTEEIAAEVGLSTTKVIAPATHDTGSAVAGLPLNNETAFISSGTWSLVGLELDKVLINEEVAKHNFTNEGGVYGTNRFLKNVMGLWILESCRREWEAIGINADHSTLIAEAQKRGGVGSLIFPDDERFLNPDSMLKAIEQQLIETNQPVSRNPFLIAKMILDSLAFRYASVLKKTAQLTGKNLTGVMVGGGGGRNSYLNQMTANASGLKVTAGLTEATVTGNLAVQAIASGRFRDLEDARSFISKQIVMQHFEPKPVNAAVRERYAAIEERYLSV